MSTCLGRAELALRLLAHLVTQCLASLVALLSLGLVAPPAVSSPGAPWQWYVDGEGATVGRAEAALSLITGVACRHSRRLPGGGWAPLCPDIPMARLNMQLVGAGAATGTMRIDRVVDGDGTHGASLAIHTSDVSDTTAYVRYPGGEVLANAKADISGFVAHPASGAVEAVYVDGARPELHALGAAGARVKVELARAAEAIRECGGGGGTLSVVSRTVSDDLWVVCLASDLAPSRYFLFEPLTSPTSQRRRWAPPRRHAADLHPSTRRRGGAGIPHDAAQQHGRAPAASAAAARRAERARCIRVRPSGAAAGGAGHGSAAAQLPRLDRLRQAVPEAGERQPARHAHGCGRRQEVGSGLGQI
jgi:hypothetical protein